MGKWILALLAGLLLAQNAFSYSIITDPNLFYSFFEKPQKTIEFTRLKDGTALTRILENGVLSTALRANLDCFRNDKTDAGSGGIAIHANAFSDDWSFKTVMPNRPETFCEAVIWFDQGISSGGHHLTVTALSGHSKPFVMYTNKGFVGIVPDSPRESVFIFDNFSVIFSFETDFYKPSSVSESDDNFVAKSAKVPATAGKAGRTSEFPRKG